MKRTLWIIVFAILAFTAILLMRLPASWFAGKLPAGVSCGQIDGTVWEGSCAGLTWQNAALGNLNWHLHAAPLLSGVLRTEVSIDAPIGKARGAVAIRSGGRIAARDVHASFPLDPRLFPSLPKGLRGTVQADLPLLRLQNGIVNDIEGTIEVHGLEQHGVEMLPPGDYVLTFPAAHAPNAEPVGDLRSTSGPLAVQGKLRLTREPGFDLQGTVAVTGEISPQLVEQLQGLGTPDANGRRPFSVAGTF